MVGEERAKMSALSSPLLTRHLLSERQLNDKITRDFLTTNIQELNAVLEGFPRGAITEITGPVSSGRTTLLETALASATSRGEYCALIDASDCFDPHSAAAAGVDLSRLLWVRCGGQADKALQCADLLVHAGGWGLIALDLAGIAPQLVRKIPISWWHRFRLAVENTPAAMLVLEREPFVRACAPLAVEMSPLKPVWSGGHPDFRVLQATKLEARSKKPVRFETARFEVRALA
jgi:hypothetical protein